MRVCPFFHPEEDDTPYPRMSPCDICSVTVALFLPSLRRGSRRPPTPARPHPCGVMRTRIILSSGDVHRGSNGAVCDPHMSEQSSVEFRSTDVKCDPGHGLPPWGNQSDGPLTGQTASLPAPPAGSVPRSPADGRGRATCWPSTGTGRGGGTGPRRGRYRTGRLRPVRPRGVDALPARWTCWSTTPACSTSRP